MLTAKQQEAVEDLEQVLNARHYIKRGQLEKSPHAYLEGLVCCWGAYHSGISPFALAGVSGISPRRILRILEKENLPLVLSYCSTTFLPVLFWDSWGGGYRDDYHQEMEELLPDGEELESHLLENLLRKYGRLSTWRKHCHREFNPFNKSSCRHPTEEQWEVMKAFCRAFQKRKKKGGRP